MVDREVSLRVFLDSESSAFVDAPEIEAARVLTKIIEDIYNGKDGLNCYDTNGNRVGYWEFEINTNEKE